MLGSIRNLSDSRMHCSFKTAVLRLLLLSRQGWMLVEKLSRRTARKERFAAQAAVVGAFRGLVLLEAPFLLWRFWFEWDALTAVSFSTLLIAKNFFWIVVDLLTIFACGDDSPVMFNFAPIKSIKNLAAGTKLSSIWVGPAGVFMLAAQLGSKAAKDSLEGTRNKLAAYRAWLQVEKYKAADQGRYFNKHIREIDELILVQDRKIAVAHM